MLQHENAENNDRNPFSVDLQQLPTVSFQILFVTRDLEKIENVFLLMYKTEVLDWRDGSAVYSAS